MNPESTLIDLEHIDTIYEGERIPVIRGVSLQVKLGEFIALIGPNGAGKTTLLETINGLLPHTNGVGTVFGKNIQTHAHSIRKNIGYVIQNFELDPLAPFLCKDIVMAGRSGTIGLFRFPSKKDWEIVWESMALVGMIDYANRPIGKLSGGEFQKILLARALAQHPKILLLDEPLSNLDVSARRQMETILNHVFETSDISILMVSHDLQYIPSNCTRIIVLDKGHIVMDDAPESVLETESINRIFHKEMIS